MRKRRVFITVLLLLVLVAAAVGFIERRPLAAWYHSFGDRGGIKGLFYCPMHPTFTSDRPGNCAICGMSLVKKEAAVVPVAEPKADKSGRKILYYRNPMNPQVTSPVPMRDEMGMDYVPVYEDQVTQHPGVYISPEKQQLIGVKKGRLAMRRRCDPAGGRTNPVAAMTRSTEEKTMKKAAEIRAGPVGSWTYRPRFQVRPLLRTPTQTQVRSRQRHMEDLWHLSRKHSGRAQGHSLARRWYA